MAAPPLVLDRRRPTAYHRLKVERPFYRMKLSPVGHSSAPRYGVRVVGRALDVLEVLRDSDRPLSLGEISRRVGLVKSSGFRLLRTLEHRGYVERVGMDGRYHLGPEFTTFVRGPAGYRQLVETALPHMQRLLEQFGETVNLGTLRDGEVLYLEILESPHAFRMTARVGARSPVHATGLGKAIAAYLPEEEIRSILRGRRFPALTSRTITSPAAWKRELALTRARGVAEDNGETEPEASCIAAPIFGADGRPIGAISLSGPASRIRASKPRAAHALVASCRAISKALGFTSTTARREGVSNAGIRVADS